MMSVSEQIRILCSKKNISIAELGRRLHKTPQAFNQKIRRESFTVDELKAIAKAAGCQYEGSFLLESGESVIY